MAGIASHYGVEKFAPLSSEYERQLNNESMQLNLLNGGVTRGLSEYPSWCFIFLDRRMLIFSFSQGRLTEWQKPILRLDAMLRSLAKWVSVTCNYLSSWRRNSKLNDWFPQACVRASAETLLGLSPLHIMEDMDRVAILFTVTWFFGVDCLY